MTALRRIGAAAIVAAAVAVAGCGDEERTATAAEAVPADALLMIDAVLRPEGEQRESIESVTGRLLGEQDPGGRIVELLDTELAERGSGLNYEDDIEPWLGERAAAFFGQFDDTEGERFPPGSAVIVETTDADEAREFLDRAADEEGVELGEAEYEGVSYLVDDEGVAGGVAGDLLAFGPEDSFRAVIDTLAGESALVDTEAFTDVVGDEELAKPALVYVDVARAVEESDQAQPEDVAAVRALFPALLETPVVATADVTEDTIELDLRTGSFSFAYGGDSPAEAIGELPATSWFAIVRPDFGDSFLALFEAARAGLGEFDAAEVREFERATGFSVERALAAVGDVALFVEGSTLAEVEGAALIEDRDPAVFRRAVAALGREAASGGATVRPLAPELGSGISIQDAETPKRVNLILGGKNFVIGYGDRASALVSQPGARLGDSVPFGAAVEAFGDDGVISAFLDFEPLVDVIESSPAGFSPDFAAARPYLDALDYAVTGGSDDGRTAELRFLVGLD